MRPNLFEICFYFFCLGLFLCLSVLTTSEIDFSCNVNATIKFTESSAQKSRDLLFFTRLQLREQASKKCEVQLHNALTYLVLRITPPVKIYMKVARHDVTDSHRHYCCDFNVGNTISNGVVCDRTLILSWSSLPIKYNASGYTRKCNSILAHKKRTDILENHKCSTALLPNCTQIWQTN